MATPPDIPAGARHLVRADGSVLVPAGLAGEVLRMLVRDINTQIRANGGQPSPAARRLLWALHDAAVRADEAPRFAAETPPEGSATVEIGASEAAELLGCTPQYVRRLARTGRITARRCGPLWLISRASLDAYRHGEPTCPTPSRPPVPEPTLT